jgi:hypothetical protein
MKGEQGNKSKDKKIKRKTKETERREKDRKPPVGHEETDK